MIKLSHVHKIYQTNDFTQHALEDISIELPSYGMVFVSGKSGCGKSTLLNIIGGIDHPSQGDFYYQHQKMDFKNQSVLNSYRLNEVSFIFQKFNLLGNAYVSHNVSIQGMITGQKMNHVDVLDCLNQVGLSDYSGHLANQLSIGQQQRVAISRALFKNSKILIADEPTSNLDSQNSLAIFNLLKAYSKDHLVVVASHDADMIQLFSDMTIYMVDGRITSIESKMSHHDESMVETKNDSTKKVSGLFIFMKALGFIKQRRMKSLFSIVLGLLTIVFFGISLTFLTMDKNQMVIDSLIQNSINHVRIVNSNTEAYTNTYDGEAFGGSYRNIDPMYKEELHLKWSRFTTEIKNFDHFDLTFMHGSAPTNYDEIAITDYIAHHTILESFDDQTSLEDLIGMEFTFNVAGRDSSFIIVVTGIIQTDFSRKNQYGMNPSDILSDSYYVRDGFIDFHLNDMIYAKGIFDLQYYDRFYRSISNVVEDSYPTIAKESKLLDSINLKVVTENGMTRLDSLLLQDNEVILPLYYYNVLFRDSNDFITKENLNSSHIEYGSKFTLEYKDQRLINQPEYRKEVILKGIIYDDLHEPMEDNFDNYDYKASNIILSDTLFNELTDGYDLSYQYLLNLKSFDVYQFFQRHYPALNNTLETDIIITPFDSTYIGFIRNIQRFSDLFIMVCVTFAVFSIIFIYYNTSSNIELHKKEIGIYRSMGLSRLNIFELFIIENIINLIIIIPSALYVIYLFTQSLNKNVVLDNYQMELLKLTQSNVIFIILFTVILLMISISAPLINLLKKTPVEIIRLD